MRRGDLVTVALQGEHGKPRPALIIQSDVFSETSSMTILPLTSSVVSAPLLRLTVEPDKDNGLRHPSQVMIDKVVTVRKEKLGPVFGQLSEAEMLRITRSLTVFLGIA